MAPWLKRERAARRVNLLWCIALAWPVIAAIADLVAWDGIPFEFRWEWPLGLLLAWLGVTWFTRLRGGQLLSWRKLRAILALGFLYDLTGNLFAFEVPQNFPVSVLMATGALCLLAGLLRVWALLFWVPFLLLELAQFAAFFQYGTRINSLVLAETMESSRAEALAYITPLNILVLLLVMGYIAFLCRLQLRVMRGLSRLRLVSVGLFFCMLSCLFGAAVPPHHHSDGHRWPFSESAFLVEAWHEATAHNIATVELATGLPSPALKPSALPTLSGDEGLVIVVHVGESVRADHMGLNGYERETTPWLCSQHRAGRLINFTDCISAAYDTCQAQIAILTDARRGIAEKDPLYTPKAGSVLDLFDAQRFGVYSFFGRRVSQKLKYDRVVRKLTEKSRQRFHSSGNPQTVIPEIARVLELPARSDAEREDENSRPHNIVLFINNEGSHTPFANFDEETAPFLPAETDFSNPSAHAPEVRNAYDNTIHYTDEFVRLVVEQLEGRPFVYLYISDHGEYLGHNGIWGRAALGEREGIYHATDGCRVGMFAIVSPEFEALHPHFEQTVARLRSNADMRIGHEHFYHTLLGLIGIETPYYNAALDLTSPNPEPYSGPAPGPDAAQIMLKSED